MSQIYYFSINNWNLYRETYQPSYSVFFHSGRTGVLKNEKIVFLPLYFASAFAQFGIDFEKIHENS